MVVTCWQQQKYIDSGTSSISAYVCAYTHTYTQTMQGFQGSFLWQGTRDDTAWCSVSAALRIFNTLGPETVRMRNHTLLTDALALVESVFGPRHVFGLLPGASCMVTLDLPPLPGNAPSPETAALVHQRLRVSYGVELPVVGETLCRNYLRGYDSVRRITVNSYNTTGVLAAPALGAPVCTVLQYVGRVSAPCGCIACPGCCKDRGQGS